MRMAAVREKLIRLSTMSPGEVAHRVRENGYSQLERFGLAAPWPRPPGGRDFKRYLGDLPAKRFYRGSREGVPFIAQHFPQWLDRAVRQGDALLRRDIQLLHFEPITLAQPIDWHRDPVTGSLWERQFYTTYSPEHDPASRDSKIIHELNRHQHLPRLAKAYLLSGDERYAAEAVSQLESWIEQNPPGVGINWQSSLEIAVRTTSWLWTIFLLLPSRSFGDEVAQKIGDSLFAQLEHVYRHTSRFSSPNTHLLGEAAALFIGGLVFQDHPRAAEWMRCGAAVLVKESNQQVLDDGVHAELSSYYHCYALDFYLQALALAEQNHFPLPVSVQMQTQHMVNFLMHLRTPGGDVPLMGDDDGGRALALEQTTYHSFHDALCLGAVLFQRPDFKHCAGGFCEETLWLLGQDAYRQYELLGGQFPVSTQAIFPNSGCTIQRTEWGTSGSQLLFDSGGLGMLTGGHSHADALSVILTSGDKQLLIDPGTSVYNGSPKWRSFFRSTRAHNTVTIDDQDQAEVGGTFRWKTGICTRTNRDASLPPEYLEAEHDGYQRLAEGVTHRRRVLHIPGEYWILADDFTGSGAHSFEFNYHFGEQVEPVLTCPAETDVEIRAPGLFLGMYSSRPIAAQLRKGQTAPIAGWRSHGYGHRQPVHSLSATIQGYAGKPLPGETAPAALTLLLPCDTSPVVDRLSVDSGDGIACAYRHGRFTDLAVFPTGTSEVRVAGFQMQGEFFWLRLEGHLVRRSLAIRGSMRRANSFLEETVCVPFAAS